MVVVLLADDRDDGVAVRLGRETQLQWLLSGCRRRTGERKDHAAFRRVERCAETFHPRQCHGAGVLADHEDALASKARCGIPNGAEEGTSDAVPSRCRMHHPAGFGLVAMCDAGVADDLVAGNREKVNWAVERLGLIELDLQVEGLDRLASTPQPLDACPVAGVESSAP